MALVLRRFQSPIKLVASVKNLSSSCLARTALISAKSNGRFLCNENLPNNHLKIWSIFNSKSLSPSSLIIQCRNFSLLKIHQYTKGPIALFADNRINVQATRNITRVSRLGKRKSCHAVRKRFFRVRSGHLKRWRSGKVHKMRKKSSWRKFRLRGSVLVKNKKQLKTLNKMLYKY